MFQNEIAEWDCSSYAGWHQVLVHTCVSQESSLCSNWEHDGHQSSSFQDREHIEEIFKKWIEINLLSVIWQK